jgi:glycosyltransferase involved in cell wall biosynthesis
VLQGLGARSLPAEFRDKTRTIYQSAPARRSLQKTGRHLRALMVGHLREEKSPETLFAAARLLAGREDIFIDHIGDALDPALGAASEATMVACPHYRWLGGRSHEETRRRIQRAHVLIHASRMEGGAHVVHEAIVSGTPVLASRIDGNVGMLGEDYAGYFDWNDVSALAGLIAECRATQASATGILQRIMEQAQVRAMLFTPAEERAEVIDLVKDCMKKIPRQLVD